MIEKQNKRPHLTAKKKFEIYLATRGENAPVGEILRENGLHLSDLRIIEEQLRTQQLKVSSAATAR